MKKITKLLLMTIFVLTTMLSLHTIANAQADYIWLEAEDGVITGEGLEVMADGGASGGKGLHVFKTDLTPTSVTMSFNIAEAGEYDVKILSLEYRMHTTNYSWWIDDNAPATLSQSSNPAIYNHYIAGSNLPVQWHDAGAVELSEGSHTITLSADKARAIASDILTYFDAVSITPSSWNWVSDGLNKPTTNKVESFTLTGGIIPGKKIAANAVVSDTSGVGETMMLALAFYKDNLLTEVQTDIKSCGTSTEYNAEITVPNNVDNALVKAFLWNSRQGGAFLTRRTEKDVIDFTVTVPETRDPVVLHISDPQIIDAQQARPGRTGVDTVYWATDKMEENCFAYIREAVEATNPDLILVTGDIVYGEFDDDGSVLTKYIEFMETLDTPWAPIFGNHDNESKKGVDWQCAQFEAAENCLFKQRTLTGNGNYTIGIKQGDTYKRVFFMLDSNGCGGISEESLANGHSTSGTGFGADQIAWYTEAANDIKAYSPDIKLTFAFHIQPQMFATAYAKYGYTGTGSVPINIDYHEDKADGDFGIIGAVLKGPWDSAGTVTNGMIALGADSILVGHEHANSASVVYEGVRYQYGQKCSVYDRNNYVAADGSIVYSSYSDAGDPIMGGTVMKLSKTDGSIADAYIYYCDTSDDAGEGGGVYDPYNPPATEEPEASATVAGLGFTDGSLSNDSYIGVATETIGNALAYKFTANSQGKVYINTDLVANKSTFTFDVYVPSTSTATLGGNCGDFAIRAKPNDLAPECGPGYFAFFESNSNTARSFTYDEWTTLTVDISGFGTSCTEFAFVIPTSNVIYVKNMQIS